jgi:hypothetical protein
MKCRYTNLVSVGNDVNELDVSRGPGIRPMEIEVSLVQCC